MSTRIERFNAGSIKVWGGTDEFVTYDVTEKVHLGEMTARVRNAVKRAITTGVLGSTNGKGAFIYKLIAMHCNIPAILYKEGDVMEIMGHHANAAMDELEAAHLLTAAGVHTFNYSGGVMYLGKCEVPSNMVRKLISETYIDTYEERILGALELIINDAVIHFNHTGV